jgi:predicted transposase/invertase (TIGR01784 family)
MLLRISRDEAERARLESEFKYVMDRQNEMVTARREGEAKGRAAERAKLAKSLLADNMPPNLVAKYTGLSLDEIERL